MNSLSDTGMILEAQAAQFRNVCLWMKESSKICNFWREKLLTKAQVGTRNQKAIDLSEDQGRCFFMKFQVWRTHFQLKPRDWHSL